MDTLSVFEVLVHQLNDEERRNLIKFISSEDAENSPAEPLETELITPDILTNSYERMNFFQKLIIFFLTLFTGEKKFAVMEKRFITHLRQGLHSRFPEYLDASGIMVQSGFFADLQEAKDLCESMQPFFQVLHSSSKPAFMAMLGELMMSTEHERISQRADLEPFRKGALTEDPKILKRRILTQLEDDLSTIDQTERKKVYESVRRLYLFQNLIEFDFSRFLALPGSNNDSVDLANLGDLLKKLSSIVASIQGLPSQACLDVLAMFHAAISNHFVLNYGYDPAKQSSVLKSALMGLMELRSKLPLTEMTRISLKNIYFVPETLAAGEDWFVIYKNYWTTEIKKRLSKFFWEKERIEIRDDIVSLLKIKNLPVLTNYRRSVWPDHITLKFDLPLSCLKAMAVYHTNGRAYPVMRKVFIDGDFYRIDNRQQFLDSYNFLHKLSELVDQTDELMNKDGPLGSALDALKTQTVPEDMKRERMQILADEAENDAEELLRLSVKNMALIVDVIHGIIYPQSGGAFDSLRNLQDIDGKRNKGFLAELEEVAQMYDSLRGLFGRLLDNCVTTPTA